MRKSNGVAIELSWRQEEELRKYFAAIKPNHRCDNCKDTRRPRIDAQQFGDERFARFACQSCGHYLHVTDLTTRSQIWRKAKR